MTGSGPWPPPPPIARCGSGTPDTGALLRILQGHTDWVHAVCAVRVKGRELLASAADDRTMRIRDPSMIIAPQITLIPTPAPALAVAQFGAGSLFSEWKQAFSPSESNRARERGTSGDPGHVAERPALGSRGSSPRREPSPAR